MNVGKFDRKRRHHGWQKIKVQAVYTGDADGARCLPHLVAETRNGKINVVKHAMQTIFELLTGTREAQASAMTFHELLPQRIFKLV